MNEHLPSPYLHLLFVITSGRLGRLTMHALWLANQDLGHWPKKGLSFYSDLLEDGCNLVISLYQDLALRCMKGFGIYSDLFEDEGNFVFNFD